MSGMGKSIKTAIWKKTESDSYEEHFFFFWSIENVLEWTVQLHNDCTTL